MIFVHIGAGAGDLDPKAGFRDGFSEFVKKKKDITKEIFLVEANPKNISKLKKSWKNYKNIKIINKAIIPNNYNKKKIKLYYCDEDAPHYQLLSSDVNHIKHYFPNSNIKSITVKTLKIKELFNSNFKNKTIESFSLDVEGLDYKLIMDLELSKYNINNISIEYMHLNFNQKKKIVNKFISNKFTYNGFGIDHNNFDWLFSNKKSLWNNLIAKLLPYIHRKHYKRLNKILFKI
jgi:FkbM family methyltransferase